MIPSLEQLDQWSAEAFGWKWHADSKCWTNDQVGWFLDHAAWHPSIDLSQAWREFVPVLEGRGLKQINFACEAIYLNGIGRPDWIKGQGIASDQQAAYAITYALVQDFRPDGYVKWLEEAS